MTFSRYEIWRDEMAYPRRPNHQLNSRHARYRKLIGWETLDGTCADISEWNSRSIFLSYEYCMCLKIPQSSPDYCHSWSFASFAIILLDQFFLPDIHIRASWPLKHTFFFFYSLLSPVPSPLTWQDGQRLLWRDEQSTPQVDGQRMRSTQWTTPTAQQETNTALEGTAAPTS